MVGQRGDGHQEDVGADGVHADTSRPQSTVSTASARSPAEMPCMYLS